MKLAVAIGDAVFKQKARFAMSNDSYPPYVIDEIMRRRGRVHAFETLDPASTALLVVDMQVAFLREGSAFEISAARDIVPNINRLAKNLRRLGGTVVWLVSTYGPNPQDRWPVLFDHILGPDAGTNFRDSLTEGAENHAIWPELDVADDDDIVSKNRFGGFSGSDGGLERLLRSHGVDTVLVAGTVTNVCCESTARESAMLNFKTIMLFDANGGRTSAEDMQTFITFLRSFGDVMTTDEAIDRLSAGAG